MTVAEIIAKAMTDSGLMGCGCCVYSDSYPDDGCPVEDGYTDHSYEGDCVHEKGRALVIAEQAVAALVEADVLGGSTIRAKGQSVHKAVQTLYDIAHSSMDWGSGFLDNAEMATVIRFAVHMGWEVPYVPSSTASPAMASVCREFPDHYEVTEVSGGRVRIKVKQ